MRIVSFIVDLATSAIAGILSTTVSDTILCDMLIVDHCYSTDIDFNYTIHWY